MMDEKVAGVIFRAWVLGILENVSQRDFIDMVKKKDYPPIFDIELPSWMNGIVEIIRRNKDKLLPLINLGKTLELGKVYRPDLAAVINTLQGSKWMETFLKQIYFLIDNIELAPYERKQKLAMIIAERKAKLTQETEPEIEEEISIPNDELEELNKE